MIKRQEYQLQQQNLLLASQQPQQQTVSPPTKKVRRTRQPRNPQLSVARRNERERNRVKMVNNGFALLREHLPFEDVQACENSGSDTPDCKTPGGAKAKKFSKVETLRAAIKRIRLLEELIRTTEPDFQSMNIQSEPALDSQANYAEEEQFSCASSASPHSQSTHFQLSQDLAILSQQQQQQPHYVQEHFVKLEPKHQEPAMATSLLSPQNSQSSHTSNLNNSPNAQYSPQSNNQTQVHHLNNQPSHTHLWIEQHQSSFIENQQQYQQLHHLAQNDWYSQQHVESKSNNWFVQQQADTEQQTSVANQHHQQHHQQQQQQQQHHLQAQVESPVWFESSSGDSPGCPAQPSPSSVLAASQPITFGHHQLTNHHQISLYSQ